MTTTTFPQTREFVFGWLDTLFPGHHRTPDGVGWIVTGLGPDRQRGVVLFSDEETSAFLAASLTHDPVTGSTTPDPGPHPVASNAEDAVFATLYLVNLVEGATP